MDKIKTYENFSSDYDDLLGKQLPHIIIKIS